MLEEYIIDTSGFDSGNDFIILRKSRNSTKKIDLFTGTKFTN